MPHQKNEPKKPTGSPIIAAVDQSVKSPWGLCPMMSQCQAVVVPSHLGMKERIIGAPQIAPVNLEVPCIGPRCHWWIADWESCCVRGIGRLPEIAAVLEPTESVTVLTADVIKNKNALVKLNEKLWRLKAEVDDLRIRLTGKEPTK